MSGAADICQLGCAKLGNTTYTRLVAVLGHPVALTTFPPTHRPPLRNQISVLNIEKDTLQLNVSRMIEDKDKMATQVDTDHDEMDRRTAQLLM